MPLFCWIPQGWPQLLLGVWACQVTILELFLPMPQPADFGVHVPPPSLHLSGRSQTCQLCHARVVGKGCLPVPGMKLWGTKPGDAFHLLGDHILGEVIVPGQSCQRTGWDEVGSEQSEGPVTGTSRGQNPAIFKFDRAEGQQITFWVIWSVLFPPSGTDFEVKLTPVRLDFNPLPLTSCMTLDNLLNLSEPQSQGLYLLWLWYLK